MRCPFCGNVETQVKDSRISDDGESVKRRRYCAACDSRFTTFERVQLRDIEVVKKNGDKRILMINGEPVSYGLSRIPSSGETRGNLAAGGRGIVKKLTKNLFFDMV